jgi:hypothetical protein
MPSLGDCESCVAGILKQALISSSPPVIIGVYVVIFGLGMVSIDFAEESHANMYPSNRSPRSVRVLVVRPTQADAS